MLRRVGVHEVIRKNGEHIPMCIVEIEDGEVKSFHQFTAEEPFTEWLGGTMEINI